MVAPKKTFKQTATQRCIIHTYCTAIIHSFKKQLRTGSAVYTTTPGWTRGKNSPQIGHEQIADQHVPTHSHLGAIQHRSTMARPPTNEVGGGRTTENLETLDTKSNSELMGKFITAFQVIKS